MMGVGKSTFGKKLASRLQWEHLDLDSAIEVKNRKTIPEIFSEQGEQAFRSMEREALKEGVKGQHYKVVSLGGGTPCFKNNAEWMKARGLCVWLDAPTGMLVSRVFQSNTERPLLAGLGHQEMFDKMEALKAEREPFYKEAHLIMSMNNLSVSQGVQMIQEIIRDKS